MESGEALSLTLPNFTSLPTPAAVTTSALAHEMPRQQARLERPTLVLETTAIDRAVALRFTENYFDTNIAESLTRNIENAFERALAHAQYRHAFMLHASSLLVGERFDAQQLSAIVFSALSLSFAPPI